MGGSPVGIHGVETLWRRNHHARKGRRGKKNGCNEDTKNHRTAAQTEESKLEASPTISSTLSPTSPLYIPSAFAKKHVASACHALPPPPPHPEAEVHESSKQSRSPQHLYRQRHIQHQQAFAREQGGGSRASWGTASQDESYTLRHQQHRYRPAQRPLPAWAPDTSSNNSNGSCLYHTPTEAALSMELVHLMQHAALTNAECEQREAIVERVRECVRALWPPVALEGHERGEGEATAAAPRVIVYGSYALGLSIASSDIDLTVAFPDHHKLPRGVQSVLQTSDGEETANAQETEIAGDEDAEDQWSTREVLLHRLHTLADYIKHSWPDLAMRMYDECRVPVLNLTHTATGIACDVNFSLMDRAEKVVTMQRAWLSQQPLARVLIVATKCALKQWGLNSVFSGGVSSTALYSLVWRFLQQRLVSPSPPPADVLDVPRNELTGMRSTALNEQAHRHSMKECPSGVGGGATGGFLVGLGEEHSGSTSSGGISPLTPEHIDLSFVCPHRAECSKKTGCNTEEDDAHRDDDEEDDDGTHMLTSSSTTAASSPTVSQANNVFPFPVFAHGGGGGQGSPTSSALSNVEGCLMNEASPRSPLETSAGDGSLFSLASALTVSAEVIAPAVPPVLMAMVSSSSGWEVHKVVNSLERMTLHTYGITLGRLFLNLWRYLSADVFMMGYDVTDAFACSKDTEGRSHSTYTECASFPVDLTANSFRLPELIALFRHSSNTLEGILHARRLRKAPSMLSSILVDPRGL